MAGAVHRLQRQRAIVLGLGGEHVLAELVPVAGGFPQCAVDKLRRLHLVITAFFKAAAHIALDLAIDGPSARMPEYRSRRLFLKVEETKLLAELAVIALLRLLQHMEIGVEFLFGAPCGAVDALQHRAVRIPAPVGTGNAHQFEGMPHAAGRGKVRAAAQVDEIALLIEGDRLAGRDRLDKLDLERLVVLFVEGDRLVTGPDIADDRLVPVDDLVHARLDGGKVLVAEGRLAMEIVIEPVLDRRADGDLRLGIQLENRLGHDMRGIMPDGGQNGVVLCRQQRQRGIGLDLACHVPFLAVDNSQHCRLGEARTDIGRDGRRRDRGVIASGGSVGKGYDRHGPVSSWISRAKIAVAEMPDAQPSFTLRQTQDRNKFSRCGGPSEDVRKSRWSGRTSGASRSLTRYGRVSLVPLSDAGWR